jgi:hypothetical protein
MPSRSATSCARCRAFFSPRARIPKVMFSSTVSGGKSA